MAGAPIRKGPHNQSEGDLPQECKSLMHVGTPPTGELGALSHLDSFVSSVPHSSSSSRCSTYCVMLLSAKCPSTITTNITAPPTAYTANANSRGSTDPKMQKSEDNIAGFRSKVLPEEHTEAGSNTSPTIGRLEVRAPPVRSTPQRLHTALRCNLSHMEDREFMYSYFQEQLFTILQGLQQSTIIFEDQDHNISQNKSTPNHLRTKQSPNSTTQSSQDDSHNAHHTTQQSTRQRWQQQHGTQSRTHTRVYWFNTHVLQHQHHGRRRHDAQIASHTKLTGGFWNVTGLFGAGKMHTIVHLMKKHRLAWLALTETHI